MATTSFTALRRFAGVVFTLLLSSACLCVGAAGQVPSVVPSATTGLAHPTGWGNIYQTALDSQGDWLVVDYGKGALYEFPAGGGPVITIIPPTGIGGGNNPGIAIDSNNTLYLEGNWSNCLLQFPYDPVAKTWTSVINSQFGQTVGGNVVTTSGCSAPYDFAQYGFVTWNWGFQPWGLAVDKNNNVWVANQFGGNWDFQLTVNGAAPAAPVETILAMTARATSVATDPELNSYYVEESDQSPLVGVLELTNAQYQAAVGGTAVASDAGLTNVAPAAMTDTTGVASDATGNLYASDGKAGIYLIPNPSGTPDTANALQLTSMTAQGAVAVDTTRHIMYVPTTVKQSNGQADVAEVNFNTAEFGSSPLGTATATPVSVNYQFYSSVVPASFAIVEDGIATPDFAITGGTCVSGNTYGNTDPSGTNPTSCLENITMTPTSVGNISADLFMLDSSNNVLAGIVLHGLGLGANLQATPSVESTLGGSLQTPSQIATDAMGNVYVADAGLGQVLMFAAGSGASGTPVSIGSGLTAPTGVAVDGSGDVFIADSGNVYGIPYLPSGLNSANQITLAGSLGTNLRLAADGLGSVYVADPTNQRVVRIGYFGGTGPGILAQSEVFLTAGLTAPSNVAVDANNNLYVTDGANLLEFTAGSGAPTTLLNNLSGANGLAIDPSGAVYISSPTGTIRVPSISGSLVPGSESVVAASVTAPTGVALDKLGNIYLTDSTAENVHVVNINSALTFAPFTSDTQTASLSAVLTNVGNAPLSATSYTDSNPLDYTAADGTCLANSPVAPGASCDVVITLNPGAGEQGTLTGTIGLASNSVNTPVINVSGVGAPLASSAAKITATGSPEVVDTPVTVVIAASAGSGVPTGTVTVSFPSWTVTIPKGTGVPTVTPVTDTVSAPLDNTGTATFNLSPVLAGSQTISVQYSGDRVFGRSTSTTTATVAKSSISALQLPVTPDPSDINLPFVLSQSGSIPYDGSAVPWQYNYLIKVNTAAGIPTGTLTFMDDSSVCPPGTSATGIGAATCALANYKGVACPQSSGAAVLQIQNSGAATGAEASFATACLYNVPPNTAYTPVIYTHYITPVYSGDSNFNASTGPQPTLFQVVRSPVVQIVTSSASSLTTPPTLNVTAGSQASLNLTLNSILGYGIAGRGGLLNDYNFPVTLACDNLPPHSACTFTYPNPDPVIPTAVDIPCPAGSTQNVASAVAAGTMQCTPGQVTLTVVTNVAVGTTTSQVARNASITFAAIFGLGMISLFVRRRAFEKGRLSMMVVLMIVGTALAASITACSTTNLSNSAVLTTPKGTYPVTVTAQQVGSQQISSGNGATQTIYGSENQVSLPFVVNVTVQ
jgi:sugar lactone lactonase YvrE